MEKGVTESNVWGYIVLLHWEFKTNASFPETKNVEKCYSHSWVSWVHYLSHLFSWPHYGDAWKSRVHEAFLKNVFNFQFCILRKSYLTKHEQWVYFKLFKMSSCLITKLHDCIIISGSETLWPETYIHISIILIKINVDILLGVSMTSHTSYNKL